MPLPTPSSQVRRFRFFPSCKEEFNNLPVDGKAALLDTMKRYEQDRHLAEEVMPLTKTYARNPQGRRVQLWEVRKSVGNNHFRLLFIHDGNHSEVCVGLTCFYKNQNKTPTSDNKRAAKRGSMWITTEG